MKIFIPSIIVVTTLLFSPLSFAEYGRKGGGGWEQRQQQQMEALSALPEDKQNLVKETMQSLRQDNMATWKEIGQLKREMKEIFTADTFDSQLYQAKGSEIKAKQDMLHEKRINTFVNLGSQLSKEERVIVMDAFSPKKFKHHRR